MPSLVQNKPETIVKIDRERRIRFNWQSANRFEEAFGRTIPQAMGFEAGARLITHLAWAGMLFHEPGLSLKETEKRINAFVLAGGDIADLAMQLAQAMTDSGVIGRPKAEPKAEENEVPAEEAGEAELDPLVVSLAD